MFSCIKDISTLLLRLINFLSMFGSLHIGVHYMHDLPTSLMGFKLWIGVHPMHGPFPSACVMVFILMCQRPAHLNVSDARHAICHSCLCGREPHIQAIQMRGMVT